MHLSGPSAVHDATTAARSFAAENRLAPEEAARLAIIVEELVNNLYDHGGLGEADTFDLEVGLGGGEIRLVLVDGGAPHDPALAVLPGDIPARGGGAGLALVRAWARQSHYRSTGDGNRLELQLPLRRD